MSACNIMDIVLRVTLIVSLSILMFYTLIEIRTIRKAARIIKNTIRDLENFERLKDLDEERDNNENKKN